MTPSSSLANVTSGELIDQKEKITITRSKEALLPFRQPNKSSKPVPDA